MYKMSVHVHFRYCGLRDPSWAELRHFVWFLNIQLSDCDQSAFCDPIFAQDLPGFKQFVVKFMVQMSRDFATRSLQLSEESPSLAAQRTEVGTVMPHSRCQDFFVWTFSDNR